MINLAKHFLRINGYRGLEFEFENLFLSHPNYPSLYAITDTLTMLSIENAAIKMPKENFEDLPENFLAIYDNELVLVHKKSQTVSIQTENSSNTNISITEFLSKWNAITVLVEKNETETVNNEGVFYKKAVIILPFLFLLFVSIYTNQYTNSAWFYLATSLIGLTISVLILQEKLGIKNGITSKVCSGSNTISCDSVIKSETKLFFGKIDFTDLPLLFFSISLVSMIISPLSSSFIIGFLSIGALPFVLYSFWLQIAVLKKWCMLCVYISIVLVLQAGYFFSIANEIPAYNELVFFGLLFSAVLVGYLWYYILPMFTTTVSLHTEINQFKKFKRNYELFNFLSKAIPTLGGLDKLKGISFGDFDAPVQLTIIVSPSCNYCHTAFQDAYALFKKYPSQIFLNILFNINPDNSNNPYKAIVENLLEIRLESLEKAQNAVIDWHLNRLGLTEWTAKWGEKSIGMVVNYQIEQQYEWCLQNNFNYTPVKMIGDKLYPTEYEIEELKYFVNDIIVQKLEISN